VDNCRFPGHGGFHSIQLTERIKLSSGGSGAIAMNMHWDNLTDREKLDLVRRDMSRIETTLSALLSELDVTWNAMKETRSELGKINKDVATLRSLWPQKYSRTG
jgi:hypothetical protein